MTAALGPSLKVLFVEDSPDLALLGTLHLKSVGYLVTTVQTASAALSHLETSHVDLIFLDLTLPDRTADDLVQIFKDLSQKKKYSLILSSGVEDIDKWAELFETSFYLKKPYNKMQILEMAKLASARLEKLSASI